MSAITIRTNGQTLTVDIARADGVRPTDVFNVTLKSLTDNVATLTTDKAHNLAAGNTVVVAGVDAVFNGTVTVVDVPSTTTFTYAKTNVNVTEVEATGTASVQGTLDSEGARVMLPASITADTTYTIPAPFGSWVVTAKLADDVVVASQTVDLAPNLPAVVTPLMSQGQLAKYVSAGVTS